MDRYNLSILIFFCVSCIALVFSFTYLFQQNRNKSKKEIPKPVSYPYILERFENINKILNSFVTFQENISQQDLDKLKIEIKEIESEIVDKINVKDDLRTELRELIKNIEEKIIQKENQLNADNIRLSKEKQSLEIQLDELKKCREQEFSAGETEINNLKTTLQNLKNKCQQVDVLKDVVSGLKKNNSQLKKQQEFQKEIFTSKVNDYAKLQSEVEEKIRVIEQQKIQYINSLVQRNVGLENEILKLKEDYGNKENEINQQDKKYNQETEYLKEQIIKAERDINSVSQIMLEHKKLEEGIEETKRNIKGQEEKYNEEINQRNKELNKVMLESESREKSIKERQEKESADLSEKQLKLEEEIRKLNADKEKSGIISEKTKTEQERQINLLRAQLKNKENQFNKLNEGVQNKEKHIKEKVLSELSGLKGKFNKQAEELKSKLKEKNDEIYRLKVKLSIREDRLRTDSEQRKKSQEKFIEKLGVMIDGLNKSNTEESLKTVYEKEACQNQIVLLQSELKKTQRNVEDEKILVNKLDQEGDRIQKEIEEAENRYLQQINELDRLIQLKSNQIDTLAKTIIQKERLFGVESTARRKIEQLTRSRFL
ncbi:MAG: hypothetical protein AUJ85_10720 [Elusimicrobia bacterium CG1_02_37_114]|nr:MAG: hypothetical protein AUJ85_10720 [Elusimicrobia bacterium CG1_02_37_114]PIZ13944.1 MAG: hypothetical protein COY53_02180 [Elusimicrobia bacterium CG_4_10_14_0_8_um_filter_37_32]